MEPVVLGKLAEPYGVRGWVRVHCFGDDPLAWAELPSWYLQAPGQVWREVPLLECKVHNDSLLALFEGFEDRTAAEALKGTLIGLPKESLPPTEEGEYYWADLLGMTVLNLAGENLGKVVSLIETGANDVLEVLHSDGSKRLIPFVGAVVQEVSKETATIRADWGSDW